MKTKDLTERKLIARINGITKTSFTAKNGRETEIIILETSEGNFSAFKSVWESQGIDPDDLTDGEELEITYYTFSKGNRTFRNFVKVAKQQEVKK